MFEWEDRQNKDWKFTTTDPMPDSWVHENNNLSHRLPTKNETDKPIWGRDDRGNKVLKGWEPKRQPPAITEQAANRYHQEASLQPMSTVSLVRALIIGALLFVAFFTVANALSIFGQTSGIADAVNSSIPFVIP